MTHFLAKFRSFFVYHHRSLEFRAKVFTAMIATSPDFNKCGFNILEKVVKDIYSDQKRQNILIYTTKEYVEKINSSDGPKIDDLLKNIDKQVSNNKTLLEKINLEHLKQFLCIDYPIEERITQERVYEFFEALLEK